MYIVYKNKKAIKKFDDKYDIDKILIAFNHIYPTDEISVGVRL
tara:strand:+ start:3199 stop:3327 length:129 start_codon:yes stop_codon:yes gene_type:complete